MVPKISKDKEETSGQDGGIDRYTLLPLTTKRKTTNLKTKNNQICQKIELYESLTTKQLKKKHSSRPAGGAEMSSRGGKDSRQSSGWRTGVGEVAAGRAGDPTFV